MDASKEAVHELLRLYAGDVNNIKFRSKEPIFRELIQYVSQKELTENAARGLIKLLIPTAAFRYRDSNLRLVAKLLDALGKSYPQTTTKALAESVSRVCSELKGETPSIVKVALTTVHWLSKTAKYLTVADCEPAVIANLAEALSAALSIVRSSKNVRYNKSSDKKLRKLFRTTTGLSEKIVEHLLSSSAFSSTDFCLIAFAFGFWSESKSSDVLATFLPRTLESYVKSVLGAKSKLPTFILEHCKPILCLVNHELFKEHLLPNIQKFLLRNPELVVGAIAYLLEHVRIELSAYAKELIKPLGVQATSKNDDTRMEAAHAIKSVAVQCSDYETCDYLLKHMFGVLNGSEGKLATSNQRITVLTAIGSLSYHTVSKPEAVDSLCQTAIKLFIPILKEEIHELTVCHALKMLELWANRLKQGFPEQFPALIKEILQKSAVPTVRIAYLQCINASYNTSTLISAESLIESLSTIVDKAIKQPASTPLVVEALPAANFLLKLTPLAANAEKKFEPLLKACIEKELFTSEKFLSVLNDTGYVILTQMLQKMLSEQAERFSNAQMQPLYRALLISLLHPSYMVRKNAGLVVKRSISSLSGGSIACHLLEEFYGLMKSDLLDKQFAPPAAEKLVKEDSSEASASTGVDPKLLANVVVCVSCVPDADSDLADEIFSHVLMVISSPRLEHHRAILLQKVLQFHHIKIEQYVEKQHARLSELAWSKDNDYSGFIPLLANIVDKQFYDRLLLRVWKTLDNQLLYEVTATDVAIMKTPGGVLYDKSVLEGKDETVSIHNMKRESKLYSYKEQLAEIEMRKELEEKWRKEGRLKKELTPKQKEAMAQQLAKEAEIRQQMLTLWKPVEKAFQILDALINGSETVATKIIEEVVNNVFPLLQSPLAAEAAAKCCLIMGCVCCRSLEQLGLSIGYATLRLSNTACQLDPAWTQEPLDAMTKRVLRQIVEQARGKETITENGNYDEDTPRKPHWLPAAALAYCFPLIKCTLEQRSTLLKGSDDLLVDVVDLIAKHFTTEAWNSGDFDLSCLPLVNAATLLIRIIGSVNPGSLQQASNNCLVELAKSVSQFSSELDLETVEKLIHILLLALMEPGYLVREYALRSLVYLENCLETTKNKELKQEIIHRLYVAKFDPVEDNSALATQLWENGEYPVANDLWEPVVEDAISHVESVRESASSAVADFVEHYPKMMKQILDKLSKLYAMKGIVTEPVYDEFGRLLVEGGVDEWEARSGVALTLRKLCPKMTTEILTFFDIMLPNGLNDRNDNVRSEMLTSSVTAVKLHGLKNIGTFLPLFEKQLDALPDGKSHDTLRQALVVLLGTLAQHLNKDDPKIRPIVAKLVETLSTPSQTVQEAVANCLPPLVPATKDQVPQMVDKLMQLLLDAKLYGERRGAAYGLAGFVKGMGILALKQLEIMSKLNAAVADQKNPRHREGALLALEMLCDSLGKLFEPYIVQVLPHLLLCFGDNDEHVRQAADECSKVVMRNLSAHGVKLVLPSLLAALEQESWRTKCGSVELLGAMAYCAPRQLSACLPSIVPKLIEVLSDTHHRVQKTGVQALKQIGKVIKNPEVQGVTDVLLNALEDPSNKTAVCLETLLHTKFVHYIDAPSLALIMPVVERGFNDRLTGTRKMAAQIVANIYSLSDQKDVEPYLMKIMPGLKKCLMDPVPEVRAVAAHALGAMVRATGEKCFEDLVPWLQQSLVSPTTSADRSGAAQGLSEVIAGLGEQQLTRVMPDILQTADDPDVEPHVRDGYIMMFVYLPTVFGDMFLPYLPKVVPSILKALADENEYVRETALRAGQRIIHTYCDTAISLLMPSLERGLFDDNWRIRFSSVQLLGDLLFKLTGVTGKMTTESHDDDTFGTESASKVIMQILGSERRGRVLAGLYISRSDVALQVRQAAGHIWKVIVSNTPRTLKEILPTLFSLLLGCLASSNYEKQQVASRSLGELVRKMGERILIDVVPVLEAGIKSEQADQRRGVCIALSAIIDNISKEMIEMYGQNLVPTVRASLCDPLPEVREAAAETFNSLYTVIGGEAIDEILTPLLDQLTNAENGAYILDGLRRILSLKSKAFLPHIIPKLTTPPVHTRALAQLAAVAGESVNRHLNKIFTALLSAFADNLKTPNEQEEMGNCCTVMMSISDEAAATIIIDILTDRLSDSDMRNKQAASMLLAYFCQNTKIDMKPYMTRLVRGLICLLNIDDDTILTSSSEALIALVRMANAKEQMDLIPVLRTSLKTMTSNLKGDAKLPGFCREKILQPIFSLLREGVLNGGADTKEMAAFGLCEVIVVSNSVSMKPHITNITGPLIRVLGDRYSANVKSALLSVLALLLEKVDSALKAFLPQLQSTFVKALNEPTSKGVRLKAALALSHLAKLHPKADALTADVTKNAKNAEDLSLKETYYVAMRLLIDVAYSSLSDETKSMIQVALLAAANSNDDHCRVAAAAALGAFVSQSLLAGAAPESVLREYLLSTDVSQDWTIRHFSSVALQVALKGSTAKLSDYGERLNKAICSYVTSDRVPVCCAGLRGAAYLLIEHIGSGRLDQLLATTVARSVNHQSNDVKLTCGIVVDYVARHAPFSVANLKLFVPSMINGTKEKNSAVRSACEEALVALLRLRKDTSLYQAYLESAESGGREVLCDAYSKALQKLSSRQEPSLNEMDDTVQV